MPLFFPVPCAGKQARRNSSGSMSFPPRWTGRVFQTGSAPSSVLALFGKKENARAGEERAQARERVGGFKRENRKTTSAPLTMKKSSLPPEVLWRDPCRAQEMFYRTKNGGICSRCRKLLCPLPGAEAVFNVQKTAPLAAIAGRSMGFCRAQKTVQRIKKQRHLQP